MMMVMIMNPKKSPYDMGAAEKFCRYVRRLISQVY